MRRNAGSIEEIKEDLQEHIKDNNAQFKHFSKRLDQFAEFLQSVSNPTVILENGEDKEILQSDAIVLIYNDLKDVKKTLKELDSRTEILNDLAEIKNDWLKLKRRVMKIVKPIFKVLVYLASIIIVAYLIVQIVIGNLTIKDAIEFFIKIYK